MNKRKLNYKAKAKVQVKQKHLEDMDMFHSVDKGNIRPVVSDSFEILGSEIIDATLKMIETLKAEYGIVLNENEKREACQNACIDVWDKMKGHGPSVFNSETIPEMLETIFHHNH